MLYSIDYVVFVDHKTESKSYLYYRILNATTFRIVQSQNW